MQNNLPADNLEHLVKCPVCNKKYPNNKALLLDEEEFKSTFHLTCDYCKASTLVFISSGQFGIVSLGMMTDLERDEARRLFKNEAITTDQVLKVHQFFKKFDGNLRDII